MTPAVAERPDVATSFRMLKLTMLKPSPLNPRKHFDPAKLQELAATMANGVGVIEPLVVRPYDAGGMFEIIAGERRYRAAAIAKLEEVPVVVKALTDPQVLELMLIENEARHDLNPLEAGAAYARMLKFGFDIDKLAARLGHTRKFVYDRMKLQELIPSAKALLEADRMSASHAILIARLTPDQQAAAIDQENEALWEREHTLWNPDEAATDREEKADPYYRRKPRSVRELEAWIDKHCRFDPSTPVNVELFPQTQRAIEEAEKVISITHDHHVLPEAKDGGKRIFSTVSWKRADGRLKSKTCDASVTGVVVVGFGRGEAFKVCVDKECDVHWKAERKAKEKAASSGASRTAADTSWEKQQKREAEERARADAARTAWQKATPALVEATAAKVKTAPIGVVIEFMTRYFPREHLAKAKATLKAGKSAEDVLRVFVLAQLMEECGRSWNAPTTYPKAVKPFKVNVAAVLKSATTSTPAQPTARGKAAKKR